MKEKVKKKIEEMKNDVKMKCYYMIDWCRYNKEAIVIFGPCIIGGIIEIVKIVTKKGTVNEQKRLKDLYIYDHSTGHYYELKRKLKSSEWITIDERKRQGTPLGIILMDMKLLK